MLARAVRLTARRSRAVRVRIDRRRGLRLVVALGVAVAMCSATALASSGASSRQELLRSLSVLRTRPTPTDRAVIACIKRTAHKYGGSHPCLRGVSSTVWVIEHPASVAASFLASLRHPKLDLALIRTVPLRGSKDSVRFFPLNWRSSPRSAQRTWGVVAGFVDHGDLGIEVFPTSVGTLRARGIALFPQLLYVGRPKMLTVHEGAIIVPDGVAKITVTTASLGGSSQQHPRADQDMTVTENATAPVHNNVATVPLKMPTFGTTFGFGPGSSLRTTWFDSRGSIIRHTTNPLWTLGVVSPQ
jgi:hypothetical protein